MSKHETEVSLSKKTEKTILSIVEQAQINADRSHKQMMWVTATIGFVMACLTAIQVFA